MFLLLIPHLHQDTLITKLYLDHSPRQTLTNSHFSLMSYLIGTHFHPVLSIIPHLTFLRLVCPSICSQIYFNFYLFIYLFIFSFLLSYYILSFPSFGGHYILAVCAILCTLNAYISLFCLCIKIDIDKK